MALHRCYPLFSLMSTFISDIEYKKKIDINKVILLKGIENQIVSKNHTQGIDNIVKPLLSNYLYYVTLFQFPFIVHFILIKPVFSDHLSYVTLFQCSLGRSHKTGLTRRIYTLSMGK